MSIAGHHGLMMGAGFTPEFTTRIAWPGTYDEDDYNTLLTWTRSGGGGPHITPTGMYGNGYDAKYKATGLPAWLSTAATDLLMHASITVRPNLTGNGSGTATLNGDFILHVGEDDSSPTPKMAFIVSRDVGVVSIPKLCLQYGGADPTAKLARHGWKYEHRFPLLSSGGFNARPQAMLFLDANTYLLTAHYEDTLSRCYKLDINSGAVLGYFDFPSPYLHVATAAMREDGTVWFADYATGFVMRVDVDASLATNAAVIDVEYDMSILASLGSIEWARLGASNAEYLVAVEYATTGSPYAYLVPAAEVVDATAFAVVDRYKRFVCSQRVQGIAVNDDDGKAYTTQNRLTADGAGNLGKIQRIDLSAQADSLSDGGTLVAEATTYAPSGLPQDLDFHPVTGWCWTSTEGDQSVGDSEGFMGVWSGPNDGSDVENHVTAWYDYSATTIIVRINNRTFGTATTSYTAAVAPACVTINGTPTGAAGLTTGYSTAIIRNVVIDDPSAMWSDDAYLTAINGLYEPNVLTAYTITLDNDGTVNNVTGWTNETGGIANRSTNPAPHTGAAYLAGGNNAATKARQRYVIATVTGLTTGQIDAGGIWARTTWLQASFGVTDDDTCGVGLRTLDGTPTQITESVAFKQEIFPEKTWFERGHALTIVSGSRNLDLLYDATRLSGTALDGYVNRIAMTIYRQ